jgi:hypothetical protein
MLALLQLVYRKPDRISKPRSIGHVGLFSIPYFLGGRSMSALGLLRNRQLKGRSQFAKSSTCDCTEQTPIAEFQGNGTGRSATVTVHAHTVPVRMLSNGWVSPKTIAPVIISGGVGFFGGMPKG